jgi:hypothetical protein
VRLSEQAAVRLATDASREAPGAPAVEDHQEHAPARDADGFGQRHGRILEELERREEEREIDCRRAERQPVRVPQDTRYAGAPPPHCGQHGRRPIEAEYPQRSFGEPGREAPGPASHVEEAPGVRDVVQQPSEQAALGPLGPPAARGVVPGVVAVGRLLEELPGHGGQDPNRDGFDTDRRERPSCWSRGVSIPRTHPG